MQARTVPFLTCLLSDDKYRSVRLQGTLEICYCSNISFRKMTHALICALGGSAEGLAL